VCHDGDGNRLLACLLLTDSPNKGIRHFRIFMIIYEFPDQKPSAADSSSSSSNSSSSSWWRLTLLSSSRSCHTSFPLSGRQAAAATFDWLWEKLISLPSKHEAEKDPLLPSASDEFMDVKA